MCFFPSGAPSYTHWMVSLLGIWFFRRVRLGQLCILGAASRRPFFLGIPASLELVCLPACGFICPITKLHHHLLCFFTVKLWVLLLTSTPVNLRRFNNLLKLGGGGLLFCFLEYLLQSFFFIQLLKRKQSNTELSFPVIKTLSTVAIISHLIFYLYPLARAGDIAQLVVCLFLIYAVLGSSPSTA